MSDNNPAEKPVNDGGGGSAPQDEEQDDEGASALGAEKPANQGGSGTWPHLRGLPRASTDNWIKPQITQPQSE